MNTENTLKTLKNIWVDIPKIERHTIDISQKEIINTYLDTFKFGDFFYLIFNTVTAEIEYVSPHIEQIVGYTSSEFNLQTLLKAIHTDDLPYFFKYEENAVEFFSKLQPELVFSYKFSYNYRLTTKDGTIKRILQQTIPVCYFPEGGCRTLVIINDITHFNTQDEPNLSFIGMNGAPSYYNVNKTHPNNKQKTIFTNKELEILNHIIAGKKSEEISKILNRSLYTIQNHRKNMLKKSGCKNVSELLSTAIRKGWI